MRLSHEKHPNGGLAQNVQIGAKNEKIKKINQSLLFPKNPPLLLQKRVITLFMANYNTDISEVDIQLSEKVKNTSKDFIQCFMIGNDVLLKRTHRTFVQQALELKDMGFKMSLNTAAALKGGKKNNRTCNTFYLGILASFWHRSILDLALIGAEERDRRELEG